MHSVKKESDKKKETRKRKRKEEIKEQVVGQWDLDKDPP